ncbi:MAG: hypothetical protein VB082_04400 [Christensenella sp.]|nr:hypothetical protein [Christensenella sp.]
MNIKRGKAFLPFVGETQVAQSTLYRWIKDYQTISSHGGGYTPHEMDGLRRSLKKAEHQLEIIRLTNLIEKVPLANKLTTLAAIYEGNNEYSVHELCEALNVARGTFYNHIFRKADRSIYLQEQQELMRQI